MSHPSPPSPSCTLRYYYHRYGNTRHSTAQSVRFSSLRLLFSILLNFLRSSFSGEREERVRLSTHEPTLPRTLSLSVFHPLAESSPARPALIPPPPLRPWVPTFAYPIYSSLLGPLLRRRARHSALFSFYRQQSWLMQYSPSSGNPFLFYFFSYFLVEYSIVLPVAWRRAAVSLRLLGKSVEGKGSDEAGRVSRELRVQVCRRGARRWFDRPPPESLPSRLTRAKRATERTGGIDVAKEKSLGPRVNVHPDETIFLSRRRSILFARFRLFRCLFGDRLV